MIYIWHIYIYTYTSTRYIYIYIYIYIHTLCMYRSRCVGGAWEPGRRRERHTCYILPPSEIDVRLCSAVFAGSGGNSLFHRIGWKGRIWQLWEGGEANLGGSSSLLIGMHISSCFTSLSLNLCDINMYITFNLLYVTFNI